MTGGGQWGLGPYSLVSVLTWDLTYYLAWSHYSQVIFTKENYRDLVSRDLSHDVSSLCQKLLMQLAIRASGQFRPMLTQTRSYSTK